MTKNPPYRSAKFQTTSAEEWKARIADERRRDRDAARAFVDACRLGDVEGFLIAAQRLYDETADGWRLAMQMVGRLPSVSKDIRLAFVPIWIESKFLALNVGDRPITAKALRVLMPRTRTTRSMLLYRGTTAGERRRRIYGFSWTTRLEIARDKFAEQRRGWPGGAVVLKTTAPPDAILLIRKAEDYYDEGEVVVDPFKLKRIEVVERLRPPPATA